MKTIISIHLLFLTAFLCVGCPEESETTAGEDTDSTTDDAYVCESNGQLYQVGDTFVDKDGCNTCVCNGDGTLSCTIKECTPNECESLGLVYFEPGCSEDALLRQITAGCYAPCDGESCETGVCQPADINPCICADEMDCCNACGMEEWMCLSEPDSCNGIEGVRTISEAGKSFGECVGECQFNLIISNGSEGQCAQTSLNVCGWGTDGCTRSNGGTLTPKGEALVSGLAMELGDSVLSEVYGCPDCADGGASYLILKNGTEETSHSYEYMNAPEELQRIDAFTMALINALNTCVSNDLILIDDDTCTP